MEYMHTNPKLHIQSTSLEQSLAIGEKIGLHVRPGQLIELVGDLGGGKTTLTKGIAKGLGITKTITSPTFSIQRSYELSDGASLEHFDLYRLEDEDAVKQEIAEYLDDPSVITVIEWAKPFIASLKLDRLVVDMHWTGDNTRDITVSATGNDSARTLEALR
jgi:tRNA threonylcarbamoyladenosine biosynthesis protein TsaE